MRLLTSKTRKRRRLISNSSVDSIVRFEVFGSCTIYLPYSNDCLCRDEATQTKVAVGREYTILQDVSKELSNAEVSSLDFLCIPLFHPRKRSFNKSNHEFITRSDFALDGEDWIAHVVGANAVHTLYFSLFHILFAFQASLPHGLM